MPASMTVRSSHPVWIVSLSRVGSRVWALLTACALATAFWIGSSTTTAHAQTPTDCLTQFGYLYQDVTCATPSPIIRSLTLDPSQIGPIFNVGVWAGACDLGFVFSNPVASLWDSQGRIAAAGLKPEWPGSYNYYADMNCLTRKPTTVVIQWTSASPNSSGIYAFSVGVCTTESCSGQ